MDSNQVYKACRNTLTCDHKFENSYMFNWESDMWFLTKSGLSVEIEVKISRSDYLADFKKKEKHLLLSSHREQNITHFRRDRAYEWGYKDEIGKPKYVKLDGLACPVSYCKPEDHIPNKFYYACPEGMIKIHEIPKYAGLIYVKSYGIGEVVKKAPQLHKIKKDWTKEILDKYFWRNLNSKNEIINFDRILKTIESPEDKIQYLTRLIKKVQTILR